MFNKEKIIFRVLLIDSLIPSLGVIVLLSNNSGEFSRIGDALVFVPLIIIASILFILAISNYVTWWFLSGRKSGERFSRRVVYISLFFMITSVIFWFI